MSEVKKHCGPEEGHIVKLRSSKLAKQQSMSKLILAELATSSGLSQTSLSCPFGHRIAMPFNALVARGHRAFPGSSRQSALSDTLEEFLPNFDSRDFFARTFPNGSTHATAHRVLRDYVVDMANNRASNVILDGLKRAWCPSEHRKSRYMQTPHSSSVKDFWRLFTTLSTFIGQGSENAHECHPTLFGAMETFCILQMKDLLRQGIPSVMAYLSVLDGLGHPSAFLNCISSYPGLAEMIVDQSDQDGSYPLFDDSLNALDALINSNVDRQASHMSTQRRTRAVHSFPSPLGVQHQLIEARSGGSGHVRAGVSPVVLEDVLRTDPGRLLLIDEKPIGSSSHSRPKEYTDLLKDWHVLPTSEDLELSRLGAGRAKYVGSRMMESGQGLRR